MLKKRPGSVRLQQSCLIGRPHKQLERIREENHPRKRGRTKDMFVSAQPATGVKTGPTKIVSLPRGRKTVGSLIRQWRFQPIRHRLAYSVLPAGNAS